MKNSLLFPNKYRVLGWILFLVFAMLGLFYIINDFEIPGFELNMNSNLTNELIIFGVTIGLLIVAFTKEKIEDEFISMLRLKSLQWAVLINYIILIILNFSIFGFAFLSMLVYNLWTVLIVFIVKFNLALFKLRKEGVKNEK